MNNRLFCQGFILLEMLITLALSVSMSVYALRYVAVSLMEQQRLSMRIQRLSEWQLFVLWLQRLFSSQQILLCTDQPGGSAKMTSPILHVAIVAMSEAKVDWHISSSVQSARGLLIHACRHVHDRVQWVDTLYYIAKTSRFRCHKRIISLYEKVRGENAQEWLSGVSSWQLAKLQSTIDSLAKRQARNTAHLQQVINAGLFVLLNWQDYQCGPYRLTTSEKNMPLWLTWKSVGV